MGVILAYGSTAVELPSPSVPYKEYVAVKQTLVETDGGQRYVYDYGVKRKIFELSWNVLNQTAFNQLRSFIENTVNFKEIPFTYTDFNGVSYNVRCTLFAHQQISATLYQATIKLEEEL